MIPIIQRECLDCGAPTVWPDPLCRRCGAAIRFARLLESSPLPSLELASDLVPFDAEVRLAVYER